MPVTPARPVHPIEAESHRILGERVDLEPLPPAVRAVVARVVHATADVEFASSLVVPEAAVAAGIAALRAGAPVVADVEMVRAGITGVPTHCYLDRVPGHVAPCGEPDLPPLTRTAAAMRMAAELHP
ncbi:MAG TPA: precorrin-8X methylmutase, partial [Acidimicrobiales bacterium]|nr:precorrin-8X methylmutase [Acidimicrobiales bacterium]